MNVDYNLSTYGCTVSRNERHLAVFVRVNPTIYHKVLLYPAFKLGSQRPFRMAFLPAG